MAIEEAELIIEAGVEQASRIAGRRIFPRWLPSVPDDKELDAVAATIAGELVLDAMAEAERMVAEASGGTNTATVSFLVPRITPPVADRPRRDLAERVLANARAHADRIVIEAGGEAARHHPEIGPIADRETLERAAGAVILQAVADVDRLRTTTITIERPVPQIEDNRPASLTRGREELFVEEAPAIEVPVVEETRPAISSRRLRVARVASWVEMIGLIAMLFVAYQLWGTGFSESHAQSRLRASFLSSTDGAATGAPGDSGATTTTPFTATGITGTVAREGSVVARIQIPKVHIDQYVVEGTKLSDLAKGPGHYTGTPLAGQQGNVAIAGHRETHGSPFERLDELMVGDQIFVTTKRGRYLYLVSGWRVVPPSDVSVLRDFGDNRLTLTTCTPKYTSLNRLIIVATPSAPAQAKARGPASAVIQPTAKAQLLDAAVADSGWHLRAFPAAMLWIALAIGMGLVYRRVRRLLPGPSAILVLVPVWGWVLLGLFEHLDKLLPSSV